MTAAIQAAAGVALRVEGPCPGGQVGAAYVAWPDGHLSVLTWRPGTRLADLRGGPLAVIEALRPAGYPAPRGRTGRPGRRRRGPGLGTAPLCAHMRLRMTDWAIRHFTAGDVGHWLDLAERRAR